MRIGEQIMENKISNTDFIEQLIYLLGAFVLSRLLLQV